MSTRKPTGRPADAPATSNKPTGKPRKPRKQQYDTIHTAHGPRSYKRRKVQRIAHASATLKLPRRILEDPSVRKRVHPAGVGTDRYPYAIHGRVESAVFNCPRCSLVIRFASYTAIQQRCACGLVLMIGLRVAVLPAGTGTRNIRHDNREPAPDTFVQLPAPELYEANTRRAPVEHGGRKLAPVPMRPIEGNDQLIAELGDGTVDPLPIIVLGVWTPGEPVHELSDPAGLTSQPYDVSSHPLLAERAAKAEDASAPETVPERVPEPEPGRSLLYDH